MQTKKMGKRFSMERLSNFLSSIIEYETPKVVKVHNTGIGLLRRGLQLGIVLYVGFYQLYVARGYQEFAGIESSVTTKVKGYSMSDLGTQQVEDGARQRYERVWDEADYVIPPAENGAFFVTTNVIITPNQTWGTCPEDPREVGGIKCSIDDPAHNTSQTCKKSRHGPKSHGPQTGRCVPSDRMLNTSVCEVTSWCPVEDDRLLLGNSKPLITGSEKHTAFIKNSIRFSHFGESFHRNNMPNGICIYNFSDPTTHLCPIFRLGDIVGAAGGNYTKMSVKGGVVAIHISWICNLDLDFMQNCIPKYNFRLLDTFGWNFRHAHFHEENRRTLYKAYGIKFVIIVQGRAGKFDLKNTVINIVAGLGLLSFITMFCDFILLHYVEERKIVKEKKFEILDRNMVLSGLLNIISATHVGTQAKESSECLLRSDKGSQREFGSEPFIGKMSPTKKDDNLEMNENTEKAKKSPAKKTNCHDGVVLALNGNKKKTPGHDHVPSCENTVHDHVQSCGNTGHDHAPSCDNTVHDHVPSCDNTGHDHVPSCHNKGHTPCASFGSYGKKHSHDTGYDMGQNKPDISCSSDFNPEAKITDINSGVYSGIEYIDSDIVHRSGWTHHKISSGQLSLHIVSQV